MAENLVQTILLIITSDWKALMSVQQYGAPFNLCVWLEPIQRTNLSVHVH